MVRETEEKVRAKQSETERETYEKINAVSTRDEMS